MKETDVYSAQQCKWVKYKVLQRCTVPTSAFWQMMMYFSVLDQLDGKLSAYSMILSA